MVRKLLIFLILISLSTLVAAEQFYRQSTPIDIRHSVRVDGFPSSNILCNLTVLSPNNTLLVDFRAMSYNSATQTHNYTLASTNTSQLGQYNYDVTCMASGLNQTDSFSFVVNPTGSESTVQQSILYIAMLILIILMFCYSLYYGIRAPYENETNEQNEIVNINWKKYLKIFSLVMAYIFFVWSAYLAWAISDGYLQSTNLGGLFRGIFTVSLSLGFPSFIFIIIICLKKLADDKKIQQKLNRGITVFGKSEI